MVCSLILPFTFVCVSREDRKIWSVARAEALAKTNQVKNGFARQEKKTVGSGGDLDWFVSHPLFCFKRTRV